MLFIDVFKFNLLKGALILQVFKSRKLQLSIRMRLLPWVGGGMYTRNLKHKIEEIICKT